MILWTAILILAVSGVVVPPVVHDPFSEEEMNRLFYREGVNGLRFIRGTICPGARQRLLPYAVSADGQFRAWPAGSFSTGDDRRTILELMGDRTSRVRVRAYSDDWTDDAAVASFLQHALSARPQNVFSMRPHSGVIPMSVKGVVASVELQNGRTALLESACGIVCFQAAGGLWWWVWLPEIEPGSEAAE